jgi:aryl-alcohol dehydrogenase-like predicted oxidoreductase
MNPIPIRKKSCVPFFRTLGRTGLSVSELSFGSLFTSSLGRGFEDSKQAVHRALDLGINLFDTAPAYANSEEILGRIIADIKTPFLLSTKLGGRPQPFDPRSKAQLKQSVQESLRLLHREVIDILFIHEPDRPQQYAWWTDPEHVDGPVIEVLDELKRDGLIRFTGLGGTTCAEMAHCIRSDRFDVVLTAFNYSPLFREATHEVLPEAAARDMGVLLGSVLHQGALGRRYDDVVRAKPAWLSKPRQQQLLTLYRLLDELGMSIVELGLRFGVSNPAISSVLIGPNEIAALAPFRPFEEPMILPLSNPHGYWGPGMANLGAGAKVGTL